MKQSILLSAALVAVLAPLSVAPALAQSSYHGSDNSARAPKRAQEAKQVSKVSKVAAMFPKATRVEPKQSGAPALAKPLQVLFDLQDKGKNDEAIAKADAILADPAATPFDKSSAEYLAGYAWLAKDTTDYVNASRYIQAAIADNGLSNNTHFQMMLQLGQMLTSDDKHAEALGYIDRYLAETNSEDPKAYGLKANVLYQMERYADSVAAAKKAIAGSAQPDDKLTQLLVADYLAMEQPKEAAKLYEEQLSKKPGDKALMLALASVYQQSGDDAKAGQVFDRMRSAGLLTENKDYEAAYRLLANIDGRDQEALAIINEGLQKGILTPGYDVYAYQGQVYYDHNQTAQAIDAWSKAAPLAKDGEMYLNLGKLQAGEQHWAAAKASAQSALAKGVKKKGDAWLVIAGSESGLKNKPAALAAYREAAKYPEARKQAEAALRQASGK